MQLSPTAISTFNHQIEAGEDVLPLYHFTKDQAFLNQECLESQVRSYPRRFPFTIARGQGAYIEDTHGQVYLDCLAGAGALPLGHNNAEVNQVLTAQIESLVPFQTLDVTTPVKDADRKSVV